MILYLKLWNLYVVSLTIYRFHRKVSEGDVSLISKTTQHDGNTGDLFSSRCDLQKPEFLNLLLTSVNFRYSSQQPGEQAILFSISLLRVSTKET